MRVLFVGGTGVISSACLRLLAEQGTDLTVLNRGRTTSVLPEGVRQIVADVRDVDGTAAALRDEEVDVVVEWIAYVPDHIRADLALFAGKVSQYVFISSASAYLKPSPFFPVVEEAPLGNPYLRYSRDKIACEELLLHEHSANGFPATIVRPSHTYGDTALPTVLDATDYSMVDRLRRGKKIVVPGDGTSLWTLTHNTDFARAFCALLGNTSAVGETFHITSDDALTWNQIVEIVAATAGYEPRIAPVSSELIAALEPELGASLLGDKSHSLVFDNSKIKRSVPGWEATVSLAEGVAASLAWFAADAARQVVSDDRDAQIDRIVAAYERTLGP